MSCERFRAFILRGVLCASALSACHEPSGTPVSSMAPLPSVQRAGSPSAPSAGAGGSLAAPDAGSASDSATGAALAGAGTRPLLDAASASPVASHADRVSTPESDAALPLVDAQGSPLPQTEDRPATQTPAFQRRIAAIANAIVSGDAEPALAAFFPLVAYQQVKDVAKPERDYKFRLLANFKRDLLEYHHALGADAAQAKFVGVTVPEKDAKWMAPGSEGNKVGYFRVLRSHLRFALPAGRSRDLELTSLISWRGEWYLVHLHGFK